MKKLAGISRILNKTFIILRSEISKPAACVWDLSVSSGLFPSLLKILRNLNPAHKKNSKLNNINYRSISLLCNIDKVLEKLIHQRLFDFLNEHKILYELQFGPAKNFLPLIFSIM